MADRERGVFVKLPSTQVIDAVLSAGLDFAVIDYEHSQLSERDVIRLVDHGSAIGLTTIVRLPAVDRGTVNRLLEAGAAGIQLSTVRSVRQVAELREAMEYAPSGRRSISLSHRQAGFGAGGLDAYLRQVRDQPPRLVAQIETATTDDSLDAIAAASPDVLFIGPTDLLVDVELDKEAARARIEEIARAAERAGVPLGGFALADPRVSYDIVSSDLALLAGALGGVAREAG